MTTPREKAAVRALKFLGRDRFTNFIREIRQDQECFAVRLINEKLDAGRDLDSIFLTGDRYGFQLTAKDLEGNCFEIEFGCLAGPLAGDGGKWEAHFDTNGSTISVVNTGRWIS